MKKAKKSNKKSALVQDGADTVDLQPKKPRRRRLAKSIIALVLVLFVVVLAIDLYAIVLAKRVLPGVHIGSTSYALKTAPEVRTTLHDQLTNIHDQPLKVTLADKTLDVTADDLGISPKEDETGQALLHYGHQGQVVQIVSSLFKSLFIKSDQSVVADIDDTALSNWVTDVAKSIDQPEINPSVKVEKGQAELVTGQPGQRLDQTELKSLLLQRFTSLSREPITLSRKTVDPISVAADHSDQLKTEAKQMVSSPLVLNLPKGPITISTKTLEPLVSTTTTASGLLGSIRGEQKLVIDVNDDKVGSLIDDLATQNDEEPMNARLQIVNGQVSVIKEGSPGRVIDRAAAKKLIHDELLARANGQPGQKSLDIPSKVVTSDVSADTLSRLGIKELIGKGTTSFAGSPQNRRHNIQTGVSFLTGIVVKPGEDFSTVKTLGTIDGSTGYLPELVIKENQTTPEFGGGLCQVSTTLFRAALNAGLTITERQNHSYRVSYYEAGVGPGLDATIYSPRPDLKIKNDTPGYILIQGYVDGDNLTFEIYGTKDGRVPEIIGPTILSTSPAPPPEYINTDTLPKGTQKQTEKAHPGAKTTATYVVRRDGQEINRQVFLSSYKPWPARYLVGTKEDNPSPATDAPSPTT